MASTRGGVVVLGVVQRDDTFEVQGLPDPRRARQQVLDLANSRDKISANPFGPDDVRLIEVAGEQVLALRVPRAGRRQRPVYVGPNPLTGTFRRGGEGDYRCNDFEIGRMFADRDEDAGDTRLLEHFGPDDLDPESVQQYRNRFSARAPEHPWLREDIPGFLSKLGALRPDRTNGQLGLTVAGLIMFGSAQSIRDPGGAPRLHLDYREYDDPDPGARWTDRVVWDGTWEGNLFQFYQRTLGKLHAHLKTPFQLGPDMFRRDETVTHQAVREALVNALIHADHGGQGGVVIEKRLDRIEISNPGTLLVAPEQLWRGGVSECRNPTLQTMFLLVGGGEKAGSGIDKILQGWQAQHWRHPHVEERQRPDRVVFTLPMVSLLPPEALERLGARFGRGFTALERDEVLAVVTAEVEGQVSNSRLQQLTDSHPRELTQVLRGLVERGLLVPDGRTVARVYRTRKAPSSEEGPLPCRTMEGDTPSVQGEASSPRSEASSPRSEASSVGDCAEAPAWRSTSETRERILDLCRGRFLSSAEIGAALDRNPKNLRWRHISPLVEQGSLELRYPDRPSHRDQGYRTREGGS
ncbi:MAG: ATP-binding protein [Pseudomonadota bacterium]